MRTCSDTSTSTFTNVAQPFLRYKMYPSSITQISWCLLVGQRWTVIRPLERMIMVGAAKRRENFKHLWTHFHPGFKGRYTVCFLKNLVCDRVHGCDRHGPDRFSIFALDFPYYRFYTLPTLHGTNLWFKDDRSHNHCIVCKTKYTIRFIFLVFLQHRSKLWF